MPTVIVEDGTIVAGANSFITSADVTAYAAARGISTWLPAAPQAQQDAAVVEAGDYLRNERRYTYRGSRRSYLQTMPAPREGAAEYRGPALPNNYISWRYKEAQCALACRAFASPGTLQADLERGGAIKSEKVGELSTEYFDKAPVETLIRAVDGLLAPLCLDDNTINATPYLAQPDLDTTAAAFLPGEFTNPPTEF